MESDLPPAIGELTPVEIEILDAALPAVALGDDAQLLQGLEAILRARISQQDWERYQALPSDAKLTVLDRLRAQIPLIAHD